MKRMTLAVALLAAVGVSSGGQEYANGDRQKLQGEWELVSLTIGGTEDPGLHENMDRMKVRFTADKIVTLLAGRELEENAYHLDETKKPKRMDVGMGAKGTRGSKCIYQLDGDTLKIAWTPTLDTAPESFDDKGIYVRTLRRIPRKP
jgi:uncharacterized protein (TIGR03067 family)